MLFVQLTRTRDSTSELLDALGQREVAVFGHSTPGQTRTPNEGNGTPERNIFFGNLCICIADQHRGSSSAMNRGSWSSRSSSTAAAARQQQRSSSGGGDVELLFLVPAPRVKPERQMKKMEHRSGTFFRDTLHITVCIADQHCGSCSAMHRGSWNSRSSSTAAAAQQQWWQRRRGYGRKGRAWIHR